MAEFEKIAVLENEVQAQLLEAILKTQKIGFRIRSYHDRVYDGLFQNQKGWGYIEAGAESKDEILALLKELAR
jgi:hypothetical protein